MSRAEDLWKIDFGGDYSIACKAARYIYNNIANKIRNTYSNLNKNLRKHT